METVLIVGMGNVGSATFNWLVKYVDVEPACYDPFKADFKKKPKGKYDIVFVCVRENDIYNAINGIYKNINDLIVIRSTVPVGTCQLLTEHFVPIHFSHLPEFSREQSMKESKPPPYFVLGSCCDRHNNMIKELIRHIPVVGIQEMLNPKTTEYFKLLVNSYLASQISFWNEQNKLIEREELELATINRLCRLEPRISSYGHSFVGLPFEGVCLPKDLKQLMRQIDNPQLLSAVEQVNEEVKGKVYG